jgi:hypothetical protein
MRKQAITQDSGIVETNCVESAHSDPDNLRFYHKLKCRSDLEILLPHCSVKY